MQTNHALTPTEMARLACVRVCTLRALGCTDTPPHCARYGGEYDANAVYVAEMERGQGVEAPRIDWVCVATWVGIGAVYFVLALGVGALVCWRWGW